ncbi:hypothetical protein [Demequina sp.]|uniref:hypothetical protein n=1 Tax=Demequina sp. TaxID=2050685 RepID=UPI003A8913C7
MRPRLRPGSPTVRTLSAVALAAVGVPLLTGCGGDPAPIESEDGQGPDAVVQSFLDAQAGGDYATALALTTSVAEDFACGELVADDAPSRSMVGATVVADSVNLNGDAASVDVSLGGDKDLTLELKREDGAWLVELPDTYGLEVTFGEPAVAQVRLADAPFADADCAVTVVDGAATLTLFPATYVVEVVDPTGVVTYPQSEAFSVDGVAREAWELGTPVSDDALATLQREVAQARWDAGLEELTLTRVWTEDGESWLAELDSADGPVTGSLERNDEGDLALDLDVS